MYYIIVTMYYVFVIMYYVFVIMYYVFVMKSNKSNMKKRNYLIKLQSDISVWKIINLNN